MKEPHIIDAIADERDRLREEVKRLRAENRDLKRSGDSLHTLLVFLEDGFLGDPRSKRWIKAKGRR